MKYISVAATFVLIMLALLSGAGTAGCGLEGKDEAKPLVVVSLSFFEDMVARVGGEMIRVKALVPVGVEPEEYEPVPGDLRAIQDAEVFIYNGHNMERWLPRIVPDMAERENCFALGEHPDLAVIPIPGGPFDGMPDPHLWTDVRNAIIYVEQIVEILARFDPGNGSYYRERGREYIEELSDLHRWIRAQLEEIHPNRRVLISSELCFQYYASVYGFYHDAIWPINASEEGTPSQITRIVAVVQETGVPAVFVENQVDHRPMQQVSRETGVPIGGVLFSDSLSKPGEGAETYIQMMQVNTRLIVEALKEE